MSTEPLVTAATITAAVTAILYLVTEFGLSLTDGQQASILGVVAVVAPLVVAAIARSRVTPVARV